MVIGLDYDYVFSHGAYRQMMRRALLRAREVGAQRILFGMGASLEKQRFGARVLRNWAYGTKTPPMPGHPDWTVDPVVENAPTTLSALVEQMLSREPAARPTMQAARVTLAQLINRADTLIREKSGGSSRSFLHF